MNQNDTEVRRKALARAEEIRDEFDWRRSDARKLHHLMTTPRLGIAPGAFNWVWIAAAVEELQALQAIIRPDLVAEEAA